MILQKQFQKQRAMDEVAKIRKRFGDEQSTLLDQFERLSFESHLNKAMLQRSLSEPGFPRSVSQPRHVSVTPTVPLLNHDKQRRCRGSGLHKVLKKLLRPIIGRKNSSGGERKKHVPDPRNPLSWKAFSRSLRF
ncbi:hypothetical protein PHAVU_010G070300 [Phaseolus vulgaris]|uniref:Uncharacterized protein n=1 Tax=Phaseolus vulgaris TaxID=3885 RepID=V7AMK6_PHAVU|nr:hypothetical protein PHAVU_010G070300g [Phaseolus vulgaris]ESW06714.1 hypothetical protein PHAVU_010G070300g [Phaseolus vulgaris]